jgi:hypothetical protein
MTVDEQIKQHLQLKQFEDAIDLLKFTGRGDSKLSGKIQLLNEEIARILLFDLKFSDAFERFANSKVNPAVRSLSLFRFLFVLTCRW